MSDSNGQVLQDLSDSWRASLTPRVTEPPNPAPDERHESAEASPTTATAEPTDGKATRRSRVTTEK